ncbi:MAG: hypothetical protein ACP5F3_02985, partial [Candidatus Syntrophosphaera sp.]
MKNFLLISIVLCLGGLAVLPLAAQTEQREENMTQAHQKFAADLFNQSWGLLLKQDRTADETATLIDMAHASLWHWRQVGQPINTLRGQWMVCHVYTLLEHREEALFHANEVMRLKEEIKPKDWDLAYCYEAMARVMALRQDKEQFQRYYGLA